jgi:hypothetical protein
MILTSQVCEWAHSFITEWDEITGIAGESLELMIFQNVQVVNLSHSTPRNLGLCRELLPKCITDVDEPRHDGVFINGSFLAGTTNYAFLSVTT